MKKYDHQSRKWVTEEEFKNIYKKLNACKQGRKDHDYVLVLPDYITYNDNYKFDPEIYYKAEEEMQRQVIAHRDYLLSVGIEARFLSEHPVYRTYKCSVCGKRKID